MRKRNFWKVIKMFELFRAFKIVRFCFSDIFVLVILAKLSGSF